jgi:hypothetical protein
MKCGRFYTDEVQVKWQAMDMSQCEMFPLVPADGAEMVLFIEPSDITQSPFSLSAEQGLVVSAAVASVWIAAWCWRAFRSVLADRSDGE